MTTRVEVFVKTCICPVCPKVCAEKALLFAEVTPAVGALVQHVAMRTQSQSPDHRSCKAIMCLGCYRHGGVHVTPPICFGKPSEVRAWLSVRSRSAATSTSMAFYRVLTLEEEQQEVRDPSNQCCKAMSIIRSTLTDAHRYIVRAPLSC